jgi:hypothetical protein
MLHTILHCTVLIGTLLVLSHCRNAKADCNAQPLPDTSLVYFVNEAKPGPAKLTRVCF